MMMVFVVAYNHTASKRCKHREITCKQSYPPVHVVTRCKNVAGHMPSGDASIK